MTDYLDQLCVYATTTNGRDKLFRLVQYECKLLKWLLAGSSKETLDILSQLGSAMSMSRNALRFFREWPQFKTFVASLDANSKLGLEGFLDSTAKLAFFFYLSFDHFMFAAKIGLWKPTPRAKYLMNQLTEGSWLIECIATVLHRYIKIGQLRDTENAVRNAHTRALVRNALDIPIALHCLDCTGNHEGGHFGGLGVLTSVMSIWEGWPGTK